MHNHILLIIPNKKEQVALSAKLQPVYNIHVTDTSKEIEQVIKNNFIQLIICTANTRDINGWEVCNQLKSSFHFSHIPVVLLAERNSLRLQIKSLEAGADAFVSNPLVTEYLQALIKSLIINRIKIAEHYMQPGQTPIAPEADNDFIKRLHGCITENIQNKVLSVDWLASTMNMSRPTLYRKIKNSTNQTPNELIGLTRLKQAALLLASANYKVFEVAEMVGFNSPSSFGKAFLKQFKVTPVAYQRRYATLSK
jgi:AraC-like DNA-binding protein